MPIQFSNNDELTKLRRELQSCKHALQLSKASANFYKDALDDAQKEIEQLKFTIRKVKQDKDAINKAQRKVKRCKKALKKAKQDKDNLVDEQNNNTTLLTDTDFIDHAKYAEIETIRCGIHKLSKVYDISAAEQNGPYQVHKNAIIRASATNPKPVLRSFGGIRAFSKQFDNLPRLIDDAAVVMIAKMTPDMKMVLQDSIARERTILYQQYKTSNMADLTNAIIDDPTHLQAVCFPDEIDAPHQIATFMVAVRVRNLIAHVNTFDELIKNHAHLRQLYADNQV